MASLSAVKRALGDWARRPSVRTARTLKLLYASGARSLPLAARAELCVALGEAAELEGHSDRARWLFAAAVSAGNPARDERLYARAASRVLLNASRLGDVDILDSLAGAGGERRSVRVSWLGALARGLARLVREDFDAARRAFEDALGLAWESTDAEAEALSHHLLAQAWIRLDRVARAREHGEAAVAAARLAGAGALELRLLLETAMFRLRASLTAESVDEAARLAARVRRTGFPRFEALAWTKIARGILVDRASARMLLSASEGLLPDGHPDLRAVRVLKASLGKGGTGTGDAALRRSLAALVAGAR